MILFLEFKQVKVCWVGKQNLSEIAVHSYLKNPLFNSSSARKNWQENVMESHSDKVPGSPVELFLGKGALKICRKFTREYPRRSAICDLLCNFIEITLWHGCMDTWVSCIFSAYFQNIFS